MRLGYLVTISHINRIACISKFTTYFLGMIRENTIIRMSPSMGFSTQFIRKCLEYIVCLGYNTIDESGGSSR